MEIPVQITSRHIVLTEQMVQLIHDRCNALSRVRPDIIRCHVVVDVPHRSRHKGHRYRVGVSISVPDEVFVSNRRPAASGEDDDLAAAVIHAFRSLKRQLSSRPRRPAGCRSRRAPRGRVHAGLEAPGYQDHAL